jgi:tetratricopeptide (TPR) repeat protein
MCTGSIGQSFTMSNKCFRQLKQADSALKHGDDAAALAAFEAFNATCRTKDARIKGFAGYAMALNRAGRYNDALTAAARSLSSSKNAYVTAWYASAVAHRGLGDATSATADLAKITQLTAKNRNVKERANIFAELAALDVQQGQFADAQRNIDAALAIDSTNVDFFVQKGDAYVAENKYVQAFEQYDKALALGGATVALFQLRSEARLKQFQDKYTTRKAGELAKQMTTAEKTLLCTELKNGVANGVKSMQIELLIGMLCK